VMQFTMDRNGMDWSLCSGAVESVLVPHEGTSFRISQQVLARSPSLGSLVRAHCCCCCQGVNELILILPNTSRDHLEACVQFLSIGHVVLASSEAMVSVREVLLEVFGLAPEDILGASQKQPKGSLALAVEGITQEETLTGESKYQKEEGWIMESILDVAFDGDLLEDVCQNGDDVTKGETLAEGSEHQEKEGSIKEEDAPYLVIEEDTPDLVIEKDAPDKVIEEDTPHVVNNVGPFYRMDQSYEDEESQSVLDVFSFEDISVDSREQGPSVDNSKSKTPNVSKGNVGIKRHLKNRRCQPCGSHVKASHFRVHLITKHLMHWWGPDQVSRTRGKIMCSRQGCGKQLPSWKKLVVHLATKHEELADKLSQREETLQDYFEVDNEQEMTLFEQRDLLDTMINETNVVDDREDNNDKECNSSRDLTCSDNSNAHNGEDTDIMIIPRRSLKTICLQIFTNFLG